MLHPAWTHLEAAYQCQKPDQGGQGEHVDDAGTPELLGCQQAAERQGKEQASQGRPVTLANWKIAPAPGDSVDEVNLGHEVRNERRTGRSGEGARRPDEKQHGVNGVDAWCAGAGQGEQAQGAKDLQSRSKIRMT